jgi:hypothetical protein
MRIVSVFLVLAGVYVLFKGIGCRKNTKGYSDPFWDCSDYYKT